MAMHPAWNRLLELAGPYRHAFEHACDAPRWAQEAFLAAALAANRDTEIGRRLGFDGIASANDFREAVPVADYAAHADGLRAWQQGGRNLCAEPVVATQWTSGSSHAAKPIPYSAAGLDGFRHGVMPWLMSLSRHDPAIVAGRVYWALSPAGTGAFAARASANDAAYLGPAAVPLMALGVVPPALADLADAALWRFFTALFLAAADDLTLLSLWSPSFLHPILDCLEQEGERIIDCLLRPDRHQVPGALTGPLARLAADGQEVAGRLRAATTAGVLETAVLWPRLRRLSCWTHGDAARQLPALERRLPGVVIEPKGLLSTESAASVPIHEAPAPVAAVNSAFLELRLDDGSCLPLWGWRNDDEGRLLITTRSGLWRYDTGDRIRVTGTWRRTPCFVFLGRQGRTCDLCGEKLDERLVRERLPAGLDAMLSPLPDRRGYGLFLDAAQVDRDLATRLAAELDAALCGILHYRHARELGQLGPVREVRVCALISKVIERLRLERGVPPATAKLPLLDPDPGWLQWLGLESEVSCTTQAVRFGQPGSGDRSAKNARSFG